MCPETVTEVKQITKEYMQNHNYARGHQTHGYRTPVDVYFDINNQVAA